MAPERIKRPRDLLRKKSKRKVSLKKNCPFENLEKSNNWPPILCYPNSRDWKVAVIPNKYPALVHHQACPEKLHDGPNDFMGGVGHHDIVLTRDHNKTIADLTLQQALQIFLLLQERYRILAADRCLLYTSTFFNWGLSAGASIYHPHYQVLTLPIIPPGVYRSIRGSKEYYKKHGRCVHCKMLEFEKKNRKRIVVKNKKAIAIAPFASQNPFEVWVYPQRHLPYFEKTSRADLKAVVAVLKQVLQKLRRNLRDPDLNFYIHTSPLKEQKHYHHYHWHIEVIPKVSIDGGFELSTGIDINVVEPAKAAAILKKR